MDYHADMARHYLLALVACATLAGCGKDDPPTPPNTPPPSGDIQVSGGERIGWRQLAADAGALGLLHYVMYIDGARTALGGVSCGSTATAEGFDCNAPLPLLTTGRHTLEIAAVASGPAGDVESERSSPLQVVMTAVSRSTSGALVTVMTADGTQVELARIAEGLRDPSDMAFDAKGNVFIAERGGKVRVVQDGTLVEHAALDISDEVVAPRGGMLAIALDPTFDETGFMYALYAVDAPRNGLEFMLARFRGVDGRFAERAVLLDRVAASPDGASGALRIGPDGKLYVALDDAAEEAPPIFSSYNGKVLRLNMDATAPDDRGAPSPIFSFDHPEPKALDWQPASGQLWVVDSLPSSGGRLRRAESRIGYALPQGIGASGATFYRGNLMPAFRGDLFIAAQAGEHLMRLQFDAKDPTKVVNVETLLKNEIGPLRVVAEGRDGALYIATDSALYALRP
jgi:aldose sugar dehydrogenase